MPKEKKNQQSDLDEIGQKWLQVGLDFKRWSQGNAGLSVSEGSCKPPQAFTDIVCKEGSRPST